MFEEEETHLNKYLSAIVNLFIFFAYGFFLSTRYKKTR